MGIEIQMLGWAIVLGLVQVMLAAAAVTRERGTAWNASARDGTPPPPGLLAGRLQRAQSISWKPFRSSPPPCSRWC